MADSSPLEFQTFTGSLDGSVFGFTKVKIEASGNELYRFFAYNVGTHDSSSATNPTALPMRLNEVIPATESPVIQPNRHKRAWHNTITI